MISIRPRSRLLGGHGAGPARAEKCAAAAAPRSQARPRWELAPQEVPCKQLLTHLLALDGPGPPARQVPRGADPCLAQHCSVAASAACTGPAAQQGRTKRCCAEAWTRHHPPYNGQLGLARQPLSQQKLEVNKAWCKWGGFGAKSRAAASQDPAPVPRPAFIAPILRGLLHRPGQSAPDVAAPLADAPRGKARVLAVNPCSRETRVFPLLRLSQPVQASPCNATLSS